MLVMWASMYVISDHQTKQVNKLLVTLLITLLIAAS